MGGQGCCGFACVVSTGATDLEDASPPIDGSYDTCWYSLQPLSPASSAVASDASPKPKPKQRQPKVLSLEALRESESAILTARLSKPLTMALIAALRRGKLRYPQPERIRDLLNLVKQLRSEVGDERLEIIVGR